MNYSDAYHIPSNFEHEDVRPYQSPPYPSYRHKRILFKDPVWNLAYQHGWYGFLRHGTCWWCTEAGEKLERVKLANTSPTVAQIRLKYAQIRLMRYITQYTKRNPSVFFGNITQF